MVGLVIVSHSRELARAAARLAQNVGQGGLPIAYAGGAGDDHEELGTDATDIMAAIDEADRGGGVVVLMDLGSAVLSARMAIDMRDGGEGEVRLCSAPLVEGAVAAAVQISIDASIDVAAAEARNALKAKINDIDDAPPPGEEESHAASVLPEAVRKDPNVIDADAVFFRFVIPDPHGLHARPAAQLVKALAGFDCEARIRNYRPGGRYADARSLNQIALANIQGGDISEIALWGKDADQALLAVEKLVRETLSGTEAPAESVPAVKTETNAEAPLEAVAPVMATLSSGVAVGTLYIVDDAAVLLEQVKVADPESEVERLRDAVRAVEDRFADQAGRLAATSKEAAIIEAERLILADAALLAEVEEAIRRDRVDAASSYQRRMRELEDGYRKLPNAYMRERAADVAGVAAQVLNQLAGEDADAAAGLGDVVIWAREAAPAHFGKWTPGQLKGVLTLEGGATSHAAIMAASMNIPALTGCPKPTRAKTGMRIAVDADRKEVVADPDSDTESDFAERRRKWLATLERDAAAAVGPAVSRDGVAVAVYANVGDAEGARAAHKGGAEGIGLLRTEFLFLNRATPPDEEEQVAALAAVLAPFAGRPAVVRLLDAGGDKSMPWLAMPSEANPFLGVRGIRLAKANPDLFTTQCRAILRAGVGCDLRIMAPMVAVREEVAAVRELVETAHRELANKAVDHVWPVRFGIMVETPAAALTGRSLAGSVDFFSIGTNDLTQYVMAAERGSAGLSELADPMQPAVLAAIGLVAAAAREGGIPVEVCGEMAADPVALRALLGLGVTEISVNPSAVGRAKRTIREAEVGRLREIAGQAVETESAATARSLFMPPEE